MKNNYFGWINIYKPKNISSFQAIKKIKKNFDIDKIGHAGTLDPLAEGILPVAIGRATKLISLLDNSIKEYEFDIKWGEQTSTDDREGDILYTSKYIPDVITIKNKLKILKGNIKQKPPKASAVKIRGIRAYKLFRKNENFTPKEKIVKLHEAKLIKQKFPNISKMKIICGGGFYIRSFARDLGLNLNSRAHIYSLKRTKVGKFTIKNSILLDDLLKIGEMAFGIRGFHSSLKMLDDILAFKIDDENLLKDISHGKIIHLYKKNFPKPQNASGKTSVLITKNDEIISLRNHDGNSFNPNKDLL